MADDPQRGASVIFGLILFLFSAAGALGLLWLIGAYAIGFGILMIILALHLRSVPHEPQTALGGSA